jgi:RNA polymerase sigma-70 factor (ECF subfamily)
VSDAASHSCAAPAVGAELVAAPVFEQLYRSDYRRLVALAYGLSGSRAAAEELVQEAFLAAHRRWNEISTYDEPTAWLRRVVVNRSVSLVRRRVAEGLALARLGGRRSLPDTLPESDESVWRAVRALPRRHAQVVALHYIDDRPRRLMIN